MDYRWEGCFSREQLQELAETGRLTARLSDGPRREIVVEAQMLRDFGNVDQAILLGHVKCLVLIIHGDNDEEEQRLLDNTRRGWRYLPEGSALEVIPGANHSFLEHLDCVIDLGRAWLTKHLPLGNE